jgi:hypothetical protein
MKIFTSRSCNFGSEGTMEISQLRSGCCLIPKKIQVSLGRKHRRISIVLSGRNFLRTIFQPLCGWLISGRRSTTQFAVVVMTLFSALGTTAETTNALSDAEIQGRQLAQKLLEQAPATNFTQTCVLKIRDGKGKTIEIPMKFEVAITETNWVSIYDAILTQTEVSAEESILTITHTFGETNKYFMENKSGNLDFVHHRELDNGHILEVSGTVLSFELMRPFANSDFWRADLGLEFFHWPAQKILKKDVHRSRGCIVLESTNPNLSANGYSRVVSWIDEESLGIVEAYAYDANAKLLKDFYPKDFKKVNGQWQVQTLIMENVQTGSRSRLEFDLNKP